MNEQLIKEYENLLLFHLYSYEIDFYLIDAICEKEISVLKEYNYKNIQDFRELVILRFDTLIKLLKFILPLK